MNKKAKVHMIMRRFVQVKDFAALCALLRLAKQELGDALSAFEYIDPRSLQAVRETSPQLLKR